MRRDGGSSSADRVGAGWAILDYAQVELRTPTIAAPDYGNLNRRTPTCQIHVFRTAVCVGGPDKPDQ
jgi:hypothetical protein